MTGKPTIYKHHNRDDFSTYLDGERVYGKTEADVTAKVETIKAKVTSRRSSLEHKSLSLFLNRRNLFAECCPCYFGAGGSAISGIKVTGAIIVGATETGTDAIRKAIGDLRLLPHHTGQVDPRRIVACYAEDYSVALLDMARKDGIEFLTPDELVASLKPPAE